MMMKISSPTLLHLKTPHVTTEWFEEPLLRFAGESEQVNPTVGIPLYGPSSLGTPRHKSEIHIGFIGTGEGVEKGRRFYSLCAQGVAGDEEQAPFPGCQSGCGYRSTLRMTDALVETITQAELKDILGIRSQKERFEQALGLLCNKLRLLAQRDHPLDYIAVVVPPEMRARCGVADYHERGKGQIHRDLRRAFKAEAMEFKKPTQLLLENTLTEEVQPRGLDHISKRAWNLFTGLYFKVDGLPWGPGEQAPGTCHVGVSFYRPLGSAARLRTSLAQAFDENGEGFILRGHSFDWDEEKDGHSPHLTEELAARLVDLVLERYREERHQYPQRVVLHKSSRFNAAERAGFQAALRKVGSCDLVALAPQSDARLIRAGTYPPLRGTSFTVGNVSYLYTTGYIPALGGFPQGHVPSPLELADHVGDTPRSQLMREVLLLTKMNWNSARMYGLLPITLRFSRLVGDILREMPENRQPNPKYKFYV